MIGTKRWRYVLWFVGGVAVFVLGGMLIIPDWPLQNLSTLLRYSSYNPPTTVGGALDFWFPAVGRYAGWIIYLLVAVAVLWEWHLILRSEFNQLLWVFSLTLVASQWIGISTDPGNFILLTLPLVLILKWLDASRHGVLWIGVTLVLLLVGLWALFFATVDRELGNLQNPIMFFPFPLFLFIGLYLIRGKYMQKAVVSFEN
jgi:hypothetical protein